MPRVTLYVKDSDAGVWDRAKALAGKEQDSLSSFVTEAITALIARRDRQVDVTDQFEQIELEGVEYGNNEATRRVRFLGKLIVDGADRDNPDAYITKGKKVVLSHYQPNGRYEIESFENFREFQQQYEGVSTGLVQSVADAMGEDYFEEID